jgi:dienelactone hydrolase
VSPWGLRDAAGNVREWCWNELKPGYTRYILGGGWNDPDYAFIFADARSPFDRSVSNGFRLVKYVTPAGPIARATLPIPAPARSYADAKPVSDEVFRVYKNLYAYDPVPLDGKVERVDDTSPLWRKENVSFTAGYGNERVPAHLYVPKNIAPPYEAIVFWPGSGAIRAASSDPYPQVEVFDFVIASGRAMLCPIYLGTFERRDGHDSSWPDTSRGYREWVMKQISDARRAVDYLESRPDVKHDALGYLGFSWGARMGSLVLGVEPRLRTGVLIAGGFAAADAPPEVDPFNFAPRVTVPVLMVNGDSDFIFQVEQAQKPLFAGLGSPPDQKHHVIFHGGHGVIFDQRSQVIREVLDWFDRYLGSTK